MPESRAVKKVPIATEKELQENLAFLAHLTGMLTEIGLKRAREKEAGKRLRESEERFRSLFDKASDGIFIMSPDGKIIEVNESFARMHGYSTGELLQMNIKDLDTTEASKLIPERMRRLLAGEILAIEVEHHHKDGHVFPMEVSANLICIGGEPFIQCFHRDITDRKRTEDALLESETRYRSIFNNGADGIVIIDPDTAIPVDFNQQACTQLGYTREEFGCLKIPDIDLLEGTEEVKARIRKVTNTGYDEFETVHRTKHGELRNVHVKAQNILAGGKSVYHCIWRDITDHKRAEAEKEKLQVQLQQAMKMEAVGRLAGGVAHDFNNLLTVITGYSELLLQKIGKESPMHREVEEIKRAGERAASLTQQLLAFSRKQIIEPRVVRLDLLVADMQVMLPRLIGEDISIQVTTGKSPGSVKVDPGQFQQVLMNLAVNARDAMPGDGDGVGGRRRGHRANLVRPDPGAAWI